MRFSWVMTTAIIFFGISGCNSEEDELYYCHYENPFTKTAECRAYTGGGWDRVSAGQDCAEPLPSAKGDLSNEACVTDGALGSCTTEQGGETEAVTWFFDADAGTLKNGCERFMGGVWASEEDVGQTEPSSELMPQALEACRCNEDVTVTPESPDDETMAKMRKDGGHIFFSPARQTAKAGFILYPGGRVDTRSFAPAAQMIAKHGYAVALVPMPGYMAMGDAVFRADMVMESHSEITRWFVAGHSLGGAAAGQYVHDVKKDISGLVILASYLDREHDISDKELPVLVLVGSQERLATDAESIASFEEAKGFLPPDTEYVFIEGGTHFGFCYSEDPRGEPALISRDEQHEIYTSKIVEMMDSVVQP